MLRSFFQLLSPFFVCILTTSSQCKVHTTILLLLLLHNIVCYYVQESIVMIFGERIEFSVLQLYIVLQLKCLLPRRYKAIGGLRTFLVACINEKCTMFYESLALEAQEYFLSQLLMNILNRAFQFVWITLLY